MSHISDIYNDVRLARDSFAKHFVNDYLKKMLTRKYWLKADKSIKVGDIVLLRPENSILRRDQWLLARVIEIFPSQRDGLIRRLKVETADHRVFLRAARSVIVIKSLADLKAPKEGPRGPTIA